MEDATNATTRQRHKIVYDTYLQVISEKGTLATDVTKRSMYEDVAQRTGYSVNRVAHIIAHSFTNGCKSKR
jgi:hypothetical protein